MLPSMSYKFDKSTVTINCPECKREFIMSKFFLETKGHEWYLKQDRASNDRMCIDCQSVLLGYIGDRHFVEDNNGFFYFVFQELRNQIRKRDYVLY